MDASTLGALSQRSSFEASNASGQQLNQDFDNFLTLLTTQLQNQDPLDPMDSTEFTNQLVAFSGVEQQIRSNTLLEQQLTMDTLNVTALGIGYIGLDVVRQGDTMQYDGTNDVTFSYEMPEQSVATTITILDASGTPVFSTGGETTSGSHEFTWNGLNSSGFSATAGEYTVNVAAQNSNDTALNVTTNVPGYVTGVETDEIGDTVLIIDGERVAITDVRVAKIPGT